MVMGRSGGSKAWVTLGMGLSLLRLLRRVTTRQEKVVFSKRLKAGERLVITNTAPPRR